MALALPQPAGTTPVGVPVPAAAAWTAGPAAVFVLARGAHAALGQPSGWRLTAAAT